jgi:hypothetical protein
MSDLAPFLRMSAYDNYLGACLRQVHGNTFANPLASSRNQRDFAAQVEVIALPHNRIKLLIVSEPYPNRSILVELSSNSG